MFVLKYKVDVDLKGKAMLSKNSEYEIEIFDLNNLGFGVGRIDGTVVFVSGAVDGDVVRAHIIYVGKDYAVAKAKEILKPSPHREKEKFCNSLSCGGCAYKGVSYEHERKLKHESVYQSFKKAGLASAHICELEGGASIKNYRNKAQYPVSSDRDGRCIAGFYAPKSHRVIEAADCPLQNEKFPKIVKFLTSFFDEYGIKAYDEQTEDGIVRHIYLRASSEGECMLTLVINTESLPYTDTLAKNLQKEFPELTSFVLNINNKKTNVICGDEYRLVYGKGYIEDTVCGVRLKIKPEAFYQINHEVAEKIYTKAKALAEFRGDECLLDLYCGTGGIGLTMAASVRELVGVEVVPEAIECARENARANGIENAFFFCADAGDTENIIEKAQKLAKRKIVPDVTVLDPPRKGSSRELLEFLSRMDCKKIVYISCNPDTLARDAKILCDEGYTMGDVYIYDMFPRTGHVESLVCFKRHIEK